MSLWRPWSGQQGWGDIHPDDRTWYLDTYLDTDEHRRAEEQQSKESA